jgi:hypothetical protein
MYVPRSPLLPHERTVTYGEALWVKANALGVVLAAPVVFELNINTP